MYKSEESIMHDIVHAMANGRVLWRVSYNPSTKKSNSGYVTIKSISNDSDGIYVHFTSSGLKGDQKMMVKNFYRIRRKTLQDGTWEYIKIFSYRDDLELYLNKLMDRANKDLELNKIKEN